MKKQSRRNFIKQGGILSSTIVLTSGISPILKESFMKTNNHYDVIIVGGSYAGLAAGMALGRALKKVLIIDSGKPCNRQTPHSHNFLTQDGKTPESIRKLAHQQVSLYNTIEFFSGLATHGKKVEQGYAILTLSGHHFTATKLIFATGIRDMMPEIKGFSDCWGISVLHCPYCHGFEVKNKTTAILGNGAFGFEFSKLISNWTNELYLCTNGKSTLTEIETSLIQKHSIKIIEKEIESLEHNEGKLSHIVFKDGSKKVVEAIYSRIPFEQHSSIPIQLGCNLNDEGYIKIDSTNQSNIEGVFACGDNVTRMRTVANAVSMGTTTGMMVNKQLIEEYFSNKTK